MAPTIYANLSNTKFALYGGDWCRHLVDTVRDHIPKYQELREAVRNGRHWTLLDQIYGLHLALQCNRKIEPDRYKYFIITFIHLSSTRPLELTHYE